MLRQRHRGAARPRGGTEDGNMAGTVMPGNTNGHDGRGGRQSVRAALEWGMSEMPRFLLVVVLLAAPCTLWARAELGPPVELLDGLARGLIRATFQGAGDTGVVGTIERDEGGPGSVTIAPGTQFWAQTAGRQGQAAVGTTRASLSQPFAQVWVPTACTNIGRPAPTERDVMIAYACPDADMERLCRSVVLASEPRASIQVAVWAIANDPPYGQLRGYLAEQSELSGGALTPEGIMEGAARLLQRAGRDPADFRMFG
jgi:hypothetical protein